MEWFRKIFGILGKLGWYIKGIVHQREVKVILSDFEVILKLKWFWSDLLNFGILGKLGWYIRGIVYQRDMEVISSDFLVIFKWFWSDFKLILGKSWNDFRMIWSDFRNFFGILGKLGWYIRGIVHQRDIEVILSDFGLILEWF